MSSIEKMAIQGIRSFGPDDSDVQMITFFSPLTLILGPNGTGKTTVIECLKYMTTGDMPPGSKGGAFIHDPKVAKEREVKGQIRLAIKDITGQHMTVQRLLLATQKAKKIEMRTLEGVITRRAPDGTKNSISQRCADIDKEMVTALGVSKAVLENVIFCHQEDSNWPLSEGKPLKEKFDAIFASTRYTKVLETIRKLKVEQDGKVKIFREELKYLKQHKDKASQLEADLEELQGKSAAARESVDKIEQQLDPIQERLEQISSRSNEIYEMKTKIEKVTKEKELVEQNIEELRANIENEFQGTTEELERAISEFDEKVEEREDTLTQFERQQQKLNSELQRMDQEGSKLHREVGGLEQEAAVYEENIQKRNTYVCQYAEELSFEGFDRGAVTDAKVQSFFDNLEAKLRSLQADATQVKERHEAHEAELQKKMDELKADKTRLLQSRSLKQEQVSKNKVEIQSISKKLAHMEESAQRLTKLTSDLERQEAALHTAEKAVDLGGLKRDIERLDLERKGLDASIKALSGELDKLHKQSSSRTQHSMWAKDKEDKEATVQRLKTKHKDSLQMLLGHMPGHDIRRKVDEYISAQTELVRKSASELNKAKSELSAKEMERNMIKKDLDKREAELKRLEERVFEVCGSQNVEEGLNSVQQKLTKAQDDRGFLMGGEHFYKKYVTDLKKEEPCCPLCHRSFQKEQDVRELILELENKLRLVPSRLQKVEQDVEELEKSKTNLVELRPLQTNISTLQDTVIPDLKNKLKRNNDEITRLREAVSEREDEQMAKESDESVAKAMHSDIVVMDRCFGEIRELEKKIAKLEETLGREEGLRSVDEVTKERQDKQLQLDTVNAQLEHHRARVSEQEDKLRKLQRDVTRLTEEKASIASELAQRSVLENSRATLTSDIRIAEREIKEAQAQLDPLESQIAKVEREKKEAAKVKEEAWETAKQEMDRVKNKGTKIKNVSQEIKAYLQAGKAEQLKRVQGRQAELEQRVKEKSRDLDDVAKSMDQLKEDLTKQQIRQRELRDCHKLQQKSREVVRLKRDLEELQAKMGQLDVSNLAREQNRLRQQRDNLQREHADSKGRQHELEGQLRNVKKELDSDLYRQAVEKHRNKMIEMRTTEIANHDLEKYYKAMDRAIMNYHTQKMDEINKIIRDLWRSTYQGNDIETIEIRSDEDESGIMKSRRNYNYRVVMIKGDTVLDMRGRCSAGQKVLASLIIRLALAETFCINCGILALDEPTTNLDRENIEGLAYALVEIIRSRERQKNFQLLVITHDEDFVELLGRSDRVEYFYRVGKNRKGCSELTRVPVRDLHR